MELRLCNFMFGVAVIFSISMSMVICTDQEGKVGYNRIKDYQKQRYVYIVLPSESL